MLDISYRIREKGKGVYRESRGMNVCMYLESRHHFSLFFSVCEGIVVLHADEGRELIIDRVV